MTNDETDDIIAETGELLTKTYAQLGKLAAIRKKLAAAGVELDWPELNADYGDAITGLNAVLVARFDACSEAIEKAGAAHGINA